MTALAEYLDFLKSKGRPLMEINPGSEDLALYANDALNAVELLNGTQIGIVGGDIMSIDGDRLDYAMQIWGIKYHCLTWSCEYLKNESKAKYILRSHKMAKESIYKAIECAKEVEKECLIVLHILAYI